MSKFSLDVLEKYVFPFTQARDPDIVLGAVFGEDVALTRVGGDILVSHIDPIVGAINNIGSEVGIEVNFSRIPIPPVVSRFAEAFRFDPLRMISSGTLVATIPSERMESAARALGELCVPVADIGMVVQGKGVNLLKDGEKINYRGIRCEEDELARMWTLYPCAS